MTHSKDNTNKPNNPPKRWGMDGKSTSRAALGLPDDGARVRRGLPDDGSRFFPVQKKEQQ